MRKILVIDTSILCVWLEIPGKTTCGSLQDKWDKARVNAVIEREEQQGTLFVLPLASLIETGNHIAQANCKNRFELAQKLATILQKALHKQTPWAACSNLLCDDKNLQILAQEWPPLAAQEIAIGDATIKHVADYYAKQSYEVEIFTGDAGLKAYQPATPPSLVPRRRRSK